MKIKNTTRYAIIMIIGVIMNEVLHLIVAALNLPMWMDIGGTAFAAVVLEPAAGIIVGFINNFYLSIIGSDSTMIIYFAASASVAVIAGVMMRKDGKLCIKRLLPTMATIILVTTAISGTITFLQNSGVPDTYWENYYFTMLKSIGCGNYLSCLFGTFVVKVYDTLALAVVVSLFYAVLPRFLKYPPDYNEKLADNSQKKSMPPKTKGK